MSLLEDDGTGGRFRAPATVLANLRRGVEEAPAGLSTEPLARATEILAEGSASVTALQAWAAYHFVRESGSGSLLYGGEAGARWVARLREDEALEEAFGALTARARAGLSDRAEQRRRNVKGQFVNEISELAPGGSTQIGNVKVSREPGRGVPKFAIRDVQSRTFEHAVGTGQATRLAQDASARDDSPHSVGGRTRYLTGLVTRNEGRQYLTPPAAPSSARLPEKGSLYFNVDGKELTEKYGKKIKVKEVPLSKITPVRARPEGVANARPFMVKAGRGEGGKRDPITLIPDGKGGYEVFDGNSTFAIASQEGWSKIPAMIVKSREEAEVIEARAKAMKARAKATTGALAGMFTPEHRGEPLQTFSSFEEMYTTAQTVQGDFEELLAATGTEIKMGPIKKKDTALRKAARKYSGNYNRVRDVVRATVVVDDLDAMPDAVAAVIRTAQARGWTVRGAEDRFLDPPPPPPDAVGPTGAGYRDVKLALVSPDGIATELQVNTRPMLEAKEGRGHALYEKQREIEGRITARGGEGTLAELQEIQRLQDEAKVLYATAREKSNGRQDAVLLAQSGRGARTPPQRLSPSGVAA